MGSTERLKTEAALDLLRSCAGSGRMVLGADGLEITPDGGVIGRLDLILDLSREPSFRERGAEALAADAEVFIREHSAENVVWDVVIDD